MQERARLQVGGGARGGAHPEHVDHVRDAGGVEAQRLVERRRALPSRKGGIRCGPRCGPADRGDGVQRAGEARLQIGGNRAGVGRTWNISYMFVTPEVSQFEMSALKFRMSSKSCFMLVTAETSQ